MNTSDDGILVFGSQFIFKLIEATIRTNMNIQIFSNNERNTGGKREKEKERSSVLLHRKMHKKCVVQCLIAKVVAFCSN